MLRVWHYGIALVLMLCGAAHVSAAEHYVPEAADSAAIEGVVSDVASGRPLQGALVRVVGSSRQDVTHEGGEYHLVNLPPGRHTVLFERLGYRREVREVSIAAGETLLYTGLTRDGTFYIEDGQVRHAVKNFRFNESPVIMLNNVDALGRPERIRGNLIPPMRIRDFTFTSLSDAI